MSDCVSCDEVMPTNECPKSQRPCGHHCNHSFDQDICHWPERYREWYAQAAAELRAVAGLSTSTHNDG